MERAEAGPLLFSEGRGRKGGSHAVPRDLKKKEGGVTPTEDEGKHVGYTCFEKEKKEERSSQIIGQWEGEESSKIFEKVVSKY